MSTRIQLISGLGNSRVHTTDIPSQVRLYLEVKAEKVVTTQARKPLNLNLVIDRSGSMRGPKLEYAKEALRFVVQHLTSDDRVSLVQYDNEVEVLYPNAPLGNKQRLLKIIDNIRSRGSTNLSGGMIEGFEQAKKGASSEAVSRVLLLSDGLANQGIRDPQKMAEIAQKTFREEGISLSTFGLGSDYDEKLMIKLAEYGGGSPHFIGLPDDIPRVFEAELSGLLAVVAQNTRVEITYPDSHLSLSRAYGKSAQHTPGKLSLPLHDLFSEDRKAALFDFQLEKAPNAPLDFSIKLVYDDVLDTLSRITREERLSLSPASPGANLSDSINRMVLEQAALFEANAESERLIEMVSNHMYAQAKALGARLIENLKTHLQHFPDSTDLQEQLKAVEEIYREIDRYQEMSVEMQRSSSKHYRSRNSISRSKEAKFGMMRQSLRKRELGDDQKS